MNKSSIITILNLLFLILQINAKRIPWRGTQTSSSTSTTTKTTPEQKQYTSLPPTVFSPDGRLYQVEKASQLVSDPDDITSSFVVAIQYGGTNDGDEDDDGGGVIVLSSCPSSPHLLNGPYPTPNTATNDINSSSTTEKDENIIIKDDNHANKSNDKNNEYSQSLWTHDIPTSTFQMSSPTSLTTTTTKTTTNTFQKQRSNQRLSKPLAMLSNHILLGTGGNAIDSNLLYRRIHEIVINMYQSSTVGILHQVQHINPQRKMRGDTINNDDDDDDDDDILVEQDGWPLGCSISCSSLARKVADMVQIPTQTVGGRNAIGRILKSAAILVSSGERGSTTTTNAINDNNDGNISIWRIDPTGQFWKCHAACVGRGAGIAEARLLQSVRQWKKESHDKKEKQNGTTEPLDNRAGDDYDGDGLLPTQKDVREYLSSLSFEDAVILACRSMVDALRLSLENDSPKGGTSTGDSLSTSQQGDMLKLLINTVGVQGVVKKRYSIASSTNRSDGDQFEMIHPLIIEKAMGIALQ